MCLLMGWPAFTSYPSLPLGSSGSVASHSSTLEPPGELLKNPSVQAAHHTNEIRISGGGIRMGISSASQMVSLHGQGGEPLLCFMIPGTRRKYCHLLTVGNYYAWK